MANTPGLCRCGMLMTLTATGDLHCTHCDREPECGGIGKCARHALFEVQSRKLAMETGP